MAVETCKLSVQTRGHCDMRDLTPQIKTALSRVDLRNGTVTAFVPGSTAALTTIEYEDGALSDFKEFFERHAPEDHPYRHNLRWGDGNGHSHLRAALLGPSLTVPFVDGDLTLGTWQQILLVDFDVKERNRTIVLQFVGE